MHKLIKKFQHNGKFDILDKVKLEDKPVVQSDNINVAPRVVTALPMGDDKTSTVTRNYMLRKRGKTDEQREKEELDRRAHSTGTIEPYNEEAHKGWMEVVPETGDVVYHAPTYTEIPMKGADMQMWDRMWSSPAFQLALTPMLDFPMIYKGLNSKVLANGIERSVDLGGKIRLSLPSHTAANPRQIVLEPKGNNQFRPHIRIWDGDRIPGVVSPMDKQTLYETMVEQLPKGSELLFPQSGPGYYGTRGTVAGLQRLGRDGRFIPGKNGVLQFIDKDGTVKTFSGTSFIKSQQVPWQNNEEALSELSQIFKNYSYDDMVDLAANPEAYFSKEAIEKLNKAGFDFETLRRNMSIQPKNFQNLGIKTTYHNPLTPEEIAMEYLKAGRPDQAVPINQDLVKAFYHKDVWPRLRRNLEQANLGLTPEDYATIEEMYKTPWEGVDMAYGYTSPGAGGYSWGPNYIRYKFGEDVPNSTVMHEIHHSIRDRVARYLQNRGINVSSVDDLMGTQLSNDMSRLMEQTDMPLYTSDELKSLRQLLFNDDDRYFVSPVDEAAATIAETRSKYFEPHWESLTPEEREAYDPATLTRLIRKDPTLEDTFWRTGYGDDIYPQLSASSNVRKAQVKAARNGFSKGHTGEQVRSDVEEAGKKVINKSLGRILDRVAGYGIPVGLGSAVYYNNAIEAPASYRNGGSLYIKKK